MHGTMYMFINVVFPYILESQMQLCHRLLKSIQDSGSRYEERM